MGSTAVTGSWKLAPNVARDVQGLVASGFGDLSAARALFLCMEPETKGGAWIAALDRVAPVSAADGRRQPAVALAFTHTGLERLSLCNLVGAFDLPFVEGMMQEDRRRRLSDDAFAPSELIWSGRPAQAVQTERQVHALLLVYEESHDVLQTLVGSIGTTLKNAGVGIVRDITLDLRPGNTPDTREHFGFVDGISQPIPSGEGTSDPSAPPDPLHGVRLGEILLGYPDAHNHTSQGPFAAIATARGGKPKPSIAASSEAAAVAAVSDDAPEQLVDLGLNGSYLVVRELRQDVDGFWASMKAEAEALNARYPERPAVKPEDLAACVIGRTLAGDVLRPNGIEPPARDADGQPGNDFLYFVEDRQGYGCPMGSHIRRANPRDGLSPESDFCADLLHSANAHRLLRRGRKFGGAIAGSDKKGDEGLLFICLNSDIARQFEFVQQNWLLNPNFATLFDEVDPLLGPGSRMTLPEKPLRRRIDVKTYVTLVGGDYFFLPSLPTLHILMALGQ